MIAFDMVNCKLDIFLVDEIWTFFDDSARDYQSHEFVPESKNEILVSARKMA